MKKIWLTLNKNLFLTASGLAAGLLGGTSSVHADAAPMYESRVNPNRTGANLAETVLNTATVNHADFGLLFSLPLDLPTIGQTLYVPNLPIQNYVHNVVYVTTNGGSVYAYDADTQAPPLWSERLQQYGYGPIQSTAVIDPKTRTLYLVQQQRQYAPRSFLLHALDLVTGAEKFGGPVVLSGTYSAAGQTLSFPGINVFQHAGLALANGQLIITFAGFSEENQIPYSGWVAAYDAGTLHQTAIFPTIVTPPASGAGIWQSGRAPVIDANNNIYLFSGNAYQVNIFPSAVNGYDGVNNFGESLLKFDTQLHLIDWFTPSNWAKLDAVDADLGSSGPTLVPGSNILIGGGKDGNLYVWNTSNLGKYRSDDSQVVQKLGNPNAALIYSGPVFWDRSSSGGMSVLYNVYNNTPIFAFPFNGSKLSTPVSSTPVALTANVGFNTAIALSANGGKLGSGIIWSLQNNPKSNISVLRAYDAGNLRNELWNSSAYLSDSLGGATTYIPPTISNGKVYTPTSAAQLVVYGLTQFNDLPKLLVPVDQNSILGASTKYAISASDENNDPLTFSATGLPAGLSINPTTGVIAGVAATAGSYPVTIKVSDGKADGQRIAGFTWNVSAN